MNSGITGLSRAGNGTLRPVPPEDIEFDVTYSIELEFEHGLDRNNPPPVEEVRTGITVKTFFDESYLPDGTYQLNTGKAEWRMHRRAGVWELSEDSLRNIIGTKLGFVPLRKQDS